MTHPLLSVIIPCYNNGSFLSEMLDCCLRQTFTDFEIIIVDDQSTDEDTKKVLSVYSGADNRIICLTRDRDPKGSVTCRNIGLQYSQGKYVIHFDADDLISDNCFENRVLFMEQNPDCDYASFPAMTFTDKNFLPKYSDKGRKFGDKCHGKDLLESFLTANYSFSTWNNIYRKEAITSIAWDEQVRIYTDFAFIVPCITAGLRHKFSDSKQLDYFYRVGIVNNMCSDFVSEAKVKSTVRLFDKTIIQLSGQPKFILRKKQFFKFIKLVYYRLLSADCSAIGAFDSFIQDQYPKEFVRLQYLRIISEHLHNHSFRNFFIRASLKLV